MQHVASSQWIVDTMVRLHWIEADTRFQAAGAKEWLIGR